MTVNFIQNFGSRSLFIFPKLCSDNCHEKLQGFKFTAFRIFVKFRKGQQGGNSAQQQENDIDI